MYAISWVNFYIFVAILYISLQILYIFLIFPNCTFNFVYYNIFCFILGPDHYSSDKFQNLFLIGIERYLQNCLEVNRKELHLSEKSITLIKINVL